MAEEIKIRTDDLDEASIFFYRIWARRLLGEEPEALVLKEPEYVVIARQWALYCSRTGASEEQVSLIATDTAKPVICAAPQLGDQLQGLNIDTGMYRGPDRYRPIIEALARAAAELPPASKNRDPKIGRWITKAVGTFEIWAGRQARLICLAEGGEEFGYTWEHREPDLYFYRSKSCKREGKKVFSGTCKLAEQKREHGKSYWNCDLLSDKREEAALIHLTPAGAGYKVFPRQLPKSFQPIPLFYGS